MQQEVILEVSLLAQVVLKAQVVVFHLLIEGQLYMAKITVYIPEPKDKYEAENQRQIIQSLDTVKTQLNTSFQQDLKNEQDTFNYFMS